MSLEPPSHTKPATTEAAYTPVVFPMESNIPFAPSLSSNASSKRAPGEFAYLAELSRKHAALAKIVREEPPSPPRLNEDVDEEAREQRINALRERVREAWLKADGNPADSKWIFLTQLLRLSVTSGREGRWIGVRTDIPPPKELKVPGLGWINAETETEWKEWEKKYQQERRVKDKVENWKKTVEPPSKGPSLQDSLDSSKASNRSTGIPTSKTSVNVVPAPPNPLQSATPFGFSVVKRLSQKNVSGKPAGSENPSSRSEKANDNNKQPAKIANAKQISDIAELSFLPPSFQSSQLATSTPKPSAKPVTSRPQKPDPIPHVAPPSPSSFSGTPVILESEKQQQQSSSPRVTKTYGRHNQSLTPSQPLEPSASLPAIPIPSTPTRTSNNKQAKDTVANESVVNVNNKRILSSPVTPGNEERALKKARTLPVFGILTTSPLTSPRRTRATPDQILTAFPRTPKTPTNRKHIVPAPVPVPAAAPVATSSSPLSPPPSSPKKQAVPTLMELLASAKKKKSVATKPSSKAKAKEAMPKAPLPEEQDVIEDKEVVNAPLPAPPPFLFPSITALDDSVHANFDIPNPLVEAEKDPFLLDPYDDPIVDMSPAKSLSSLAGSDSEDEVEDPDDSNSFGFSFKPLATSTQRGPFVSTGSIDQNHLNAIASGSGMSLNDQPAQLDLSQGTKDSWESIYAPTSGSGRPQPPVAPASSNHAYAYNSQFSVGVAKNVYDVDRLLLQDVDLAYSGWIQDPYADDEEGGNDVPDSSP